MTSIIIILTAGLILEINFCLVLADLARRPMTRKDLNSERDVSRVEIVVVRICKTENLKPQGCLDHMSNALYF